MSRTVWFFDVRGYAIERVLSKKRMWTAKKCLQKNYDMSANDFCRKNTLIFVQIADFSPKKLRLCG